MAASSVLLNGEANNLTEIVNQFQVNRPEKSPYKPDKSAIPSNKQIPLKEKDFIGDEWEKF